MRKRTPLKGRGEGPKRARTTGRCPNGGKISFPTRKDVLRWTDYARQRGELRGHTHPYRCPNCGDWHFTSQERAA